MTTTPPCAGACGWTWCWSAFVIACLRRRPASSTSEAGRAHSPCRWLPPATRSRWSMRPEWFARAAANAKTAGVRLTSVHTSRSARYWRLSGIRRGVVSCGVDVRRRAGTGASRALRTLTNGALLSLLKKNRNGRLLCGQGWTAITRRWRWLLKDRVAVGTNGHREPCLRQRRVVADADGDRLGNRRLGWRAALLRRRAGRCLARSVRRIARSGTGGVIEPYRSVSRLVHFIARATPVEMG